MQRYDFIMAGGGMAGLSLAYHLATRHGDDPRILVIDLETKTRNDRTWCFWTPEQTPFESIVHKRWPHIWFRAPGFEERFDLAPYEYRMIRGIDYYGFIGDELGRRSNVDIINTRVNEIRDGAECATVVTEDGSFEGRYVFDSRFIAREFTVDQARYHFVKQHFAGWFVRMERPMFDPETATMFDLRIPQAGVMRFMYILPFDPHTALLEYTLFSSRLLPAEEYQAGIRDYIREYLDDASFEILEDEDGVIPMTDQPFPRRAGNRILNIGTRGGMVKASTGFAFQRTQADSARILDSVITHGHPFHGLEPPRRYRTFDAMLLELLENRGELSVEIFTRLFQRNPLPRLWRFLDEEGSLGENIKLMATVPWFPFIAAYFNVKLARPLRARLGMGNS